MRKTPRAALVTLDPSVATPLYRQIYDRIGAGIASGALRPGDRLPSARNLAAQLGTARGTVDAAYAMLQGEGYVVSRVPAGTIVSPELALRALAQSGSRPKRGGASGTSLVGSARIEAPLISTPFFRLGVPALDAFPRTLWSRLVTRRARALAPARMIYPDPIGIPELRQAIANYLRVSRGISCSSHQVFITNGYQEALALFARALLHPGDPIWFEDPGYPQARDGLEGAGATLVPVRVDAEGICVSEGVAQAPNARFVVVTPSHQSPLGVPLSLPRRLSLLTWARETGAWIIEDDYDGEFRYVGRPLPALKSLDRDERVLYGGSFSKVLFPDLRLGYLVVPEALVAPFAQACRALNAGHSSFEQHIVADFMTEGHFARHLKRMRNLYSSRRRALANGLAAVFGNRLSVELEDGGMHLIARLRRGVRDTELARRAWSGGLAVEALSTRAKAYPCGSALLLGFTNIPENEVLIHCRHLDRLIGKWL